MTLHSLKGETVSVWDFKQKRNRVIAFVSGNSPGTRRFVRDIAAHAAEWKERETVALIVFPEAPPADLLGILPAEVVAGVDASGRSLGRYLGEDAFGSAGHQRQGVFVADRYGEIYARWIIAKDDDFPGVPEIVKTLEQIEIACEECQPTHWPLDG
ncbi:MAG TPA: hypothetical protein VGT03_02815 [Candidatus Acidoferrales bacterium]|nr:hypothetical protein [Candidatus Acidoferrales bacterium]